MSYRCMSQARRAALSYLCVVVSAAALLGPLTACGPDAPQPLGGAQHPMQGRLQQEMQPGQKDDTVWAMRFVIPVRWKGNLGMDAGSGEIVHDLRSVAVRRGDTTTHALRLCGVTQPAYALRPYLGRESYQARYPSEALDAASTAAVPWTMIHGEAGTFATDFAALQLGASLDDPLNAPMPGPGEPFVGQVLTGADGTLGFTSIMRRDPPFVGPPVNMMRTRRAVAFHVAMRHLVGATGGFLHDGFAEGRVRVAGINKRAALNTQVLACTLEDGSACTAGELYDLNRFTPNYAVAGPGRFVMQRVSEDTDCGAIRAMAFAP